MRPHCPRCTRPLATCLCRWITSTDNRLPLLVLQHPLEARHAKGSVRLLQLSLARCLCLVGETFDAAALGMALRADGVGGGGDGGAGTDGATLLFPATPGSAPIDAPGTALPCRGPLVLLDGTWRQARRLLQANPALQALPRYSLPAPPPSRYAIRHAHRPEQRSSLEAACLALGALEHRPAHYTPLLAAFEGWVAQVAARAATRGPVNPAA